MTLFDMTSPEVDALSRDTVIVFPCGATEQHSRHLPVCTDTLLVTTVAERAAAKEADKCLLLPSLWFGASHHHLTFPGTLSASTATHALIVTEVIESLLMSHFHRFLVLNGHGGNIDPIHCALREIVAQMPDTTMVCASYWELAKSQFSQIATGPLKAVGHACELETSMMLAVRPDLVRIGEIDDDCLVSSAKVEGLDVITGFDVRTTHGGRGYPSYATKEKGEALLFAAVDATATAISAMREGLYWVQP